jgi:hypothetical protein
VGGKGSEGSNKPDCPDRLDKQRVLQYVAALALKRYSTLACLSIGEGPQCGLRRAMYMYKREICTQCSKDMFPPEGQFAAHLSRRRKGNRAVWGDASPAQ